MGCRSKRRSVTLALILGVLLGLSGCVSYQYERRIAGIEIEDPGDAFLPGKTTITEVLSRLGAPDAVHSLSNTDMLVYQRSLSQESGLSLGIPVLEVAAGGSIDISATGALKRYDTLAFWFDSQGMLADVVFLKASSRPYLETLFSD